MPPKIKPDAEKLALRAQIVDAARSLFVQQGVEAVTMRAVAQRIGYSATSIYLYFGDKEQLIRAVIDDDILRLAQALRSTLQLTDPRERLLQFGRHYVRFALAFPNHYRMMFMTAHPPCIPALSSVQQNNPEQDAYYQLISVVTSAHQAGVFQPDLQDPVLIAQTIWAAMHGLCSLEINLAEDQWVGWRPFEQRLEAMVRMTIQGMMKESPHV
ncbi:MAG TPA: TetR/AcrR family transcriptional regulator [Methylophilus sp.]